MTPPRFDEIGYWSEIKLDIVRKYAQAYSTVLANEKRIRRHLYIAAFAGAGEHVSKQTGEFVPGSPLNALNVHPPFSEYHFIDLDGGKAEHLRQLVGNDPRVCVYEGDCNSILLQQVFPRARYGDFHRALCLLDPYALNLNWEVVEAAGASRSIEIFLNFMVMDMNMNVLWRNPDKVRQCQIDRMDAFWGGPWRNLCYKKARSLFDDLDLEDKASNDQVAAAYQERLKKVAGFAYVPDPMPMRNTRGAIVYCFVTAKKWDWSQGDFVGNCVEHGGVPCRRSTLCACRNRNATRCGRLSRGSKAAARRYDVPRSC